MVDFYIRQLTVSGEGVEPSVISFEPGTNLIFGNSDMGKSYVVECLDFIFGAKTMRLRHSSGYSTVTAIIQTKQGEIRLERRFDVSKKAVSIFSTDPRFESFCCTGVDRDVLDTFWLRLIGIRENQTVIVNGDYGHELLKWNNIKKPLLLKETEISSSVSVIPGSTKTLSALLFLLTGMDFANMDPRESDADRTKRLKGAREQILKQMREIDTRRLKLMEEMSADAAVDSSQAWEALMDRFTVQEKRLKAKMEESLKLHEQLEEARKLLGSYQLQHANHQLLRTLYSPRIRRLTFVMQGLLLDQEHAADCKCPLCEKEVVESQVTPEMIEAVKAEIEQAEMEIRRFIGDSKDLERKMAAQKALMDEIAAKCESLDTKIRKDYAPGVKELQEQIKQHEASVKRQHELDLLGVEYTTLDNDLSSLDAEKERNEQKFRPKEFFPQDFFAGMARYLSHLLLACGFSADEPVDFVQATMDISINYQDKSTYGEGYRAFLNTAVAFCLFRYLCDYGKYAPGILILDSPIQAMREREGENRTKQLFNYIYENSRCGQVIIVDNRIPEGSSVDQANVISFHEDGGFLPDFVRPTKKRKKKSPAYPPDTAQLSIDDLQ